MDFNLSKENIQPLRGGRNVSQLGVALQAQTNTELQRELMQRKEEFENMIKAYTGNDPLEIWFNYISWVEQSYPKHGHEGNLIPLLEHCLRLFENDKQYLNDRRFCKLWIKYIDFQQNPLELFHMMHARGLCRGCADLYKAWAYYHEAAGDYQNANHVFECGKRELAQPYEELEIAHNSLYMAAGQHMINGPDERRLQEKRHALTSLSTYKAGRVGTIRHATSNMPGIVPSAASVAPRSNVGIPVYEDKGDEVSGAEAAPISLITVAKRQEMPKENTLKPGPWTKVPVKKRLAVQRTTPSFTVPEDDAEQNIKFPKCTEEDYNDFKVSLTVPEPKDPKFKPMYPKEKVYSRTDTEFSLEELRAYKYLGKKKITKEDDESDAEIEVEAENSVPESQTNQIVQNKQLPASYIHEQQPTTPAPVNNFAIWSESSPQQQQQQEQQQSPTSTTANNIEKQPKFSIYEQSPVVGQAKNLSKLDCDIWSSPAEDKTEIVTVPKNNVSKFVIYEQSTLCPEEHIEPKGSAMKTPFKDLNAEELAETGSRGGMDVAAAAPVSAKRLPQFDEYDIEDYDINTQTFNFNLNAVKVSTPSSEEPVRHWETKGSKKQLFCDFKPEEKALSTIVEESKSYGSSTNSSNGTGATTKSTIFGQSKPNSMTTISEEHNRYLAQNMKANAALRRTLLGDIMDYEVTTPAEQPSSPIRPATSPTYSVNVSPLKYVPSDPFKPTLIMELLKKVAFPGPHTRNYYELSSLPKLSVRAEPTTIGHDRYVIERQLGRGNYGSVFRACDLKSGRTVALKHQKSVNKWEFYICRELRERLADHPLQDRFMDVKAGYFSDFASILVSDFMPCGSLLDVTNAVKQKSGRSMKESLCIYFCLDMLKVVQAMHDVKIIHADIKPDNFLVQMASDGTVTLQLIDFGCSIDMSLFPPDAMFTRIINTENFICCEMLDGRPWNYHTDLFCVAATAHVLLFDKYLQLRNKDGHWSVQQRIPRYLRIDLWNMFFSTLLNQQTGPADSGKLHRLLEEHLKMKNDDFHADMRTLLNILKNR